MKLPLMGDTNYLRSMGKNIKILPPGATLVDFIAACQLNSLVQRVDFYVMAGAEEIVEDHPKIKRLPIYSKAVGSDRRITQVEQFPVCLGAVSYSIADSDCSRPLGFCNINPIEDLKEYAWENAIYLAQQGFNAVSYFRFKSGPLEEVCRIMSKEAKQHQPLSLPIVIY